MTSFLRRLAPWLVVAILGFGAGACGGGDDEPSANTGNTGGSTTGSADAPSNGGGDGAWEGEFETGTDVSLTLWVDPASDPVLTKFEAFREASGANPVLYARAEVTNDGNAQDTSRFAVLTDEDGDTFGASRVEVGFLCSQIARWIAAVATPNTELNAQYTELLSEECGENTLAGPTIAPGETVTYYLAYEGETEPEFERIFMGVGNELKR